MVTGLYEVEIQVNDSDIELKHGFFAKGEIIPSQTLDCYSLPINAIQEGLGKSITFYSVNEDGHVALKQETQVVAMNNEKIFIDKADFYSDMMIIIERQKELKHLDKVKIIKSDILVAANESSF
jgi:hypothetical protein